MKIIKMFFLTLVPIVACADECATGYSILDDSGLCKIQCDAGYYVATAGGTCTALNSGYIETHTVIYGDVSTPELCPDGGFVPAAFHNGGHTSISRCVKRVSNLRYNNIAQKSLCPTSMYETYSTHGIGSAGCYWRCDSNGNCGYGTIRDRLGNPKDCVGGSTLALCDAGYYAMVLTNGNALAGHPCSPVGMGYYSPNGDLRRYACPENTATCGRGDCAADISDCVPYKTLHIGEYELKMPSRYYTAPSLAISMPSGEMYYAQTSTRNIAHGLKVMRDNIIYSIINAEEDFCDVYYGVSHVIADPN